MTTYATLSITTDLTDAQLVQQLNPSPTLKYETLQALENWVSGLKNGESAASIRVTVGLQGGTQASQTITIASNSASSVTINGVLYTGGSDYVISTKTVTQIAAEIVVLVNASTDTRLMAVVASNLAGVVTITAKHPGAIGNLYTLAATGAGSVGGANLAGGVDATLEVFNINR